jgi:uncharacterized protein
VVTSRRSFIKSGALYLAATGSLAEVVSMAAPAAAHAGRGRSFAGYGELLADPAGILDLPPGFQYRIFSREGEAMTLGGRVPSSHDGMAAFDAGALGTWLVRNHELNPDDVAEDGLIPVPTVPGATYDPEAVGGTTTLLIGPERRLRRHQVSLAGTLDNCAGGPTPWRTWLSCEESDAVLSKPHGYVFEVDPWRGGNPEPILGMGRFEHEAVSFDRQGRAYLTEDASGPFGCIYRFLPRVPLGGRGSLHAGGRLQALCVTGVSTDLSIVHDPGSRFGVRWVDVGDPNPAAGETPLRERAIALGATPIMKAEGTWLGIDGSIWFVSSRGDGPLAANPNAATAAAHSGQIWRYDPRTESLELVVLFPTGSAFDGPDNITAGPHGYAIACTDGEDDQWLLGIGEDGSSFPFALNALDDGELAGATFAPDGQTLFVNLQGPPGLTLGIWGPWQAPLGC